MDIQDLIVAIIVIVCIVYVLLRIVRYIKNINDNKNPCSGCISDCALRNIKRRGKCDNKKENI